MVLLGTTLYCCISAPVLHADLKNLAAPDFPDKRKLLHTFLNSNFFGFEKLASRNFQEMKLLFKLRKRRVQQKVTVF